uniref:Uncharacterized protein n=1 Tax=Ciona intestinalis TaxID=7719 RepID=H2XWE9_CIOIN
MYRKTALDKFSKKNYVLANSKCVKNLKSKFYNLNYVKKNKKRRKPKNVKFVYIEK